MNADEFIAVLVTAGSGDEAERIAATVVDEQLAACVNIVGPIRSIYTWAGKLQHDNEMLLIIKTRAALFSALEQRVRQLHSYQTPEIIALALNAASQPYLDWLGSTTKLRS
ncbi:MAG: divalent-cation tolerance protein CutA [Deltaproteobacteria bacterium]|nr:divalent-cation tolerance protein CutA [Deltaproteobacteria bacterium]